MKGNSECEYCKKIFDWYRPKTRSIPRFCCHDCRLKSGGTGFRPGGQIRISELTKEQKFDRLNKSFEKNVVRQEGCWDWKGSVSKGGYPVMTCRRSIGPDRGHKASWIIHKGEIPKGMFVCHSCDNPICTNPEHLWLGTHKQNNDDKISKGRAKYQQPPIMKGDENPSRKLCSEQVKEIRNLLAKGFTCVEISKKFNVHQKTISRIKCGHMWSDIK